jgi:hypothetical protein
MTMDSEYVVEFDGDSLSLVELVMAWMSRHREFLSYSGDKAESPFDYSLPLVLSCDSYSKREPCLHHEVGVAGTGPASFPTDEVRSKKNKKTPFLFGGFGAGSQDDSWWLAAHSYHAFVGGVEGLDSK